MTSGMCCGCRTMPGWCFVVVCRIRLVRPFFLNGDGSRKSYDGRQPIQVSNGTQRAYAAWSCGILGLINLSKETCKDKSLVRVSDNYVVGKGTQGEHTQYGPTFILYLVECMTCDRGRFQMLSPQQYVSAGLTHECSFSVPCDEAVARWTSVHCPTGIESWIVRTEGIFWSIGWLIWRDVKPEPFSS